MIVEICKSEMDEMQAEGIAYFNMFVNFLFDMYADLDKQDTVMKNISKNSKEVYDRYKELLMYIKNQILDDFMIVYITRVGTSGLVDMI